MYERSSFMYCPGGFKFCSVFKHFYHRPPLFNGGSFDSLLLSSFQYLHRRTAQQKYLFPFVAEIVLIYIYMLISIINTTAAVLYHRCVVILQFIIFYI